MIAGIAWAVSGDPVRFAEVLVVATPCPLLLAAPVADGGEPGPTRTRLRLRSGDIQAQGRRADRIPLVRLDGAMTTRQAAHAQRENLGRLMFGDPHRVDDLAVLVQAENLRRARFKSDIFPMVTITASGSKPT